ncbi:MAG: acyl-CoA thioesterase [Alphaproteobacteria bacterium]|nr:acyl-CoA thioesterase [Alphaproteobacteria bacterium]
MISGGRKPVRETEGRLWAEVIVKAEFYDLDPMQIVWHGNYTRFLEQARAALLDRIGYGYVAMAESGLGWPIVDLRIKYVKPLRLHQEVRVRATLLEWQGRLRMGYRISDCKTGEVLTKAETVQFAVDARTGEVLLDTSFLAECVRTAT